MTEVMAGNTIGGIAQKRVSEILATISGDRRVMQVIIFGSRAKGTFRPGSDIDLCLEAPELDWAGLRKLENELDDLMLPWKVDLLLLHRIDNPELVEHVERVGQSLYRRDGAA
jgi:predicted nucleotidyltransferase